MMLILSTILGFFGPFLPELIKWFNRKQDNAHELALLKQQGELAAQGHAYRMAEITTTADLAASKIEQETIYRQPQSFGVQVLDAAKDWPRIVVVPVFWAFAFIDFLNASVRPVITYWVVGFYLFYKWSLYTLARARLGWQDAVVANWSENDHAMMMLCLGYFFGQRAAKAAFGGTASTGRVGGG